MMTTQNETNAGYETIYGGIRPIKAWVRGVEVDEGALEQLRKIALLPFIEPHVAVMPDVHLGKGATVGSVIPTRGAIVPAAVGVDIGCGMMAVRTSLTADSLPDGLSGVRAAIERAVPHGRTRNGGSGDAGAYRALPKPHQAAWGALKEGFDRICDEHPSLVRGNTENHLGTLGTGNHFIEVCLDEEARVWIVLHSGSRGVGNRDRLLLHRLGAQGSGAARPPGPGPRSRRTSRRARRTSTSTSRLSAGRSRSRPRTGG